MLLSKPPRNQAIIASIAVIVLFLNAPYAALGASGMTGEELREAFQADLSNGVTEATPGEVLTYTFTFKHSIASDSFRDMMPGMVARATDTVIHTASDDGRIGVEHVVWEEVGPVNYGQSVTRTFTLTIPGAHLDQEYCVDAAVSGTQLGLLQVATARDCTKIVAKKAVAVVVSSTTPTPTPTPAPAVQPVVQPQKVQAVVATPAPAVNPIDPDGDGLPTDQEYLYGSDPNVFDTDGDGVADGEEVREGRNPAGDEPELNQETSAVAERGAVAGATQNVKKSGAVSRLVRAISVAVAVGAVLMLGGISLGYLQISRPNG